MKTAIFTVGIAILAMAGSKSIELQGPEVFFSEPLSQYLPGKQGRPLSGSNNQQQAGSCKCGQQYGGRIVGGTDVYPGEIPWRVQILSTLSNGKRFQCGGTILSPNWVLTAAHCFVFEGGLYVTRVDVHYGDVRASSRNSVTGTFINHQNYTGDENLMHDDISLVKLDDPIPLGDPRRPAAAGCLPYKLKGVEGSGAALASGWGKTRGNDDTSTSRTLKKVYLDLIPNCDRKKTRWGIDSRIQVCTETPGKSTCQGDSGGSIDVQAGGNIYAYGIVSFGEKEDCSTFSAYTRVSAYLDWIEQTTKETYCKA